MFLKIRISEFDSAFKFLRSHDLHASCDKTAASVTRPIEYLAKYRVYLVLVKTVAAVLACTSALSKKAVLLPEEGPTAEDVHSATWPNRPKSQPL